MGPSLGPPVAAMPWKAAMQFVGAHGWAVAPGTCPVSCSGHALQRQYSPGSHLPAWSTAHSGTEPQVLWEALTENQTLTCGASFVSVSCLGQKARGDSSAGFPEEKWLRASQKITGCKSTSAQGVPVPFWFMEWRKEQSQGEINPQHHQVGDKECELLALPASRPCP